MEADDGQTALPMLSPEPSPRPDAHGNAPGDRHLLLVRDGARYVCKLDDGRVESGSSRSRWI